MIKFNYMKTLSNFPNLEVNIMKIRNSVYARYTQDKNALDFIHWG